MGWTRWVFLDEGTHGSAIESAIALGARGPDRGPLSAIEHAELQHGEIGGAGHDAAECVDFTGDGPFGDAADGWVAGHLPDAFEGARDERDRGACAGGGDGGFGAGMTGADHDDVEVLFIGRHRRSKLIAAVLYSQRAAGLECGAIHPLITDSMPIPLPSGRPALVIQKGAFERSGLTRAALDERLGLTPDEFRVEGDLVCIGPIPEDDALQDLIADLEDAGLTYFEDFFELTGNWPDWLSVYVMARRDEG